MYNTWLSNLLLLGFVSILVNEVSGQGRSDGRVKFAMAVDTNPTPSPVLFKERRLLSPYDSIFLLIEEEQKYLIHEVKKAQTVYAIGEFYGIPLVDLYYMNPRARKHGLKVGQRLKIPIPSKSLKCYKPKLDTAYLPVYYKVRPSETLYRIAKVYLDLPIEIIKTRNNLSSNILLKNQVLHLAWFPKTGVPDTLKNLSGLSGVLGQTNLMHQKRYTALSLDKKEVVQEGVACWLKGTTFLDKASLSVLHNQLPVGGIVKIENPMNDRIVYAKVVGPIPETSLAEGSIIMLSPNVAYGLGVLDTRFFARVHYLK